MLVVRDRAVERLGPEVLTLRRMAVAWMLRAEAERLGLTTRALASRTGLSAASVNRSMTGKRPVSMIDVGAFGAAFGWSAVQRERIGGLAAGTGEVDGAALVQALEEVSAASTVAAPWVLPSMLRTTAYQDAVNGPTLQPGGKPGRRRPQKVTVFATLDALLLPGLLGSAERAGQIAHLEAVTRSGDVQIRLLPDRTPGLAPLGGFELFEAVTGEQFVRTGHGAVTVLLDHPGDVAPYRAVLDHLAAVAAGPFDWWQAVHDTV